MPDFSLDEKYLVVKENLLKAYKKYTKKPFGKYYSSRVGLGEPALKDNKLLDEWTEINNNIKIFIKTAGFDISYIFSQISSLILFEKQKFQKYIAEICLQYYIKEINSNYLKDIKQKKIKNWNNLADFAKIPRILILYI